MPEHESTYERRDINAKVLLWSVVGLVVGVIVVFVTVTWYFHSLGRFLSLPAAGSTHVAPEVTSPEPRLQIDACEDLEKLRAAEDVVLQTYGWVDRKQGVVRLPVERAMELLAQRGLPATQPQAKTPP